MLHIIDTSVIQYNILHSLELLAPNGIVHDDSLETYEDAIALCLKSMEALTADGDRMIWVGDSKPYFRKSIVPEYKAGRTPKPDCYHNIVAVVDNVHDVWRIRTMEADDLVALIAVKSNAECLIWTIDSDLMQLISPRVSWFNAGPWEPRMRSWGNWQEWFIKRRIAMKYWKKASGPHEAICSWKYTLGDKADNYGKQESEIIYNLLKSPVFGMVTDDELAYRLETTYVPNPGQGESAYRQLIDLGFKPPVLRIGETASGIGWDD
jgi:5'-3' exonuclease